MRKAPPPKGLVFAAVSVGLALLIAFVAWSLARNARIERIETMAARFHDALKPDPANPDHAADLTCRILTWRFAKTHWFDVGDPIIPRIEEDHRRAGCDPTSLETIRQTHARLNERR